jgi:hypothetical protein
MAFPLAAVLKLAPTALSTIGSLFGGGGKKQQYSPMMTPEQQALMNQLLSRISQGMKTNQNPGKSILQNTFFNQGGGQSNRWY